MQNITLNTLKNAKSLVPYMRGSFEQFIREHCYGFENIEEKIQTVTEEVELTIFEDMTLNDLLESAILVAAQNIQNDIDYDKLATRLLITNMYIPTIKFNDSDMDFKKAYGITLYPYRSRLRCAGL